MAFLKSSQLPIFSSERKMITPHGQYVVRAHQLNLGEGLHGFFNLRMGMNIHPATEPGNQPQRSNISLGRVSCFSRHKCKIPSLRGKSSSAHMSVRCAQNDHGAPEQSLMGWLPCGKAVWLGIYRRSGGGTMPNLAFGHLYVR